MASLPAAVVAVVVRYRRAQGIQRAQLKWLAFAIVLLPLLPLSYGVDQVLHTPVTYAVSWAAFPLLILLPLAIAVALLRYRLYEIDWVVNRTLVYAAITALLAAIWLGLAFGLGVLAGGESAWVAAAATAAVAIAFGPVRRRIQDIVDRHFARARYDAVRSVQAFESAVREGRALPEDVEPVLRTALGDPSASLALRTPRERRARRPGRRRRRRCRRGGRDPDRPRRPGHRRAPPRPGARAPSGPLARRARRRPRRRSRSPRLRVELRLHLAEVRARDGGSCRPRTTSADGSSATSTTAPSSAS